MNPKAGKGVIRQRFLEVVDEFVKSGYEVVVRTTQRAGEIPEILKQMQGPVDKIVCCGGDGTFNETVCGLLETGLQVPLGYIPAGTVNDFAASHLIPTAPLEAAKTAAAGAPELCDVGKLGERCFAYVAAFGAFTDVSYQTPQPMKALLGRLAYIVEGIKRLPHLKAYPMKIIYGDQVVEDSFIYGMVSNSKTVGGFKLPSGGEIRMDDGLLEAVFIRKPETMADRQEIVNALLRQDLDSPLICKLQVRQLELAPREKIPWTVDGEFAGEYGRVAVRCLPRAVTILS